MTSNSRRCSTSRTAPFRILRAAAGPIRAFAKAEAEQGREVFRKVVNISSVSGLGGNPGQVNYAAAKAAVVGMTKTLAKEWGRYRVNVNCVAFGFIQTRMTQPMPRKSTNRLARKRALPGSS
jgi:3-oxoacyl-[acyl-carrier protein] reductase